MLSSLPPTFRFSFPPLHLQPDISYPHPNRRNIKYNLLSSFKWRLTDPAKRTSSLRCSAPQNLLGGMRYLGCSYGYLIFSNREHCLLLDVYSGAEVRPPQLKSTGNHEIYYGILVAALNSPNSCLLLCSRSSMFQWQVGTNSWLEHPFDGERILQIVFFKDEMFAMDFLERLHRIRLAPQLSVQEVAVVWGEDMVVGLNFKPWLVVCGDMLLLVDLSVSIDVVSGFSGTFKVFRLDFSVEPAKWVKVENLGNNALFVSFDRRNQTFACMGPEKWGGKSNCIYVASRSEDSAEAWTVVELGQAVPSTTLCCSYRLEPIQAPSGHSNQPQNLWVLPSLVYGVRQ
uniref:KIB1-4 beta-propeller domain-containing protein n=1 Tax=Arundo donax TaxID=35708 RepID=A0A0A8YQA2_ARUDO